MLKLQFPHFTRLKPARLIVFVKNSVLWTSIILLILANVYSTLNIAPAYWKGLEMVFQTPFTATGHEVLAYDLWKEGHITQARNELKLSQSLPKDDQIGVLGVSSEDTLSVWNLEPERAEAAFAYWKNIVATKPEFRDAHLQLSVAAYALGKLTESKSEALSVLTLDPSSATARQLLEALGNNQR